MKLALLPTTAVLVMLGGVALAQDEKQAPIPFAGGELTITQKEEHGEKVLAFDGKELAHNYVVYYDRTVTLGDVAVAMVDVGDGGNACGPAKVLVWKPQGGDVRTETVGADCGAPPAAVGDTAIYFVPYLLPGDSQPVLQWSPDEGLVTSGMLTYAPEPGTGWADLDPAKFGNIVDSFHNEAVYEAARKLLGEKMGDVATGLLVGGGAEKTPLGAFYGSGCVPHACGGADGFMAVDPGGKAVYFAQQQDGPAKIETWPPLEGWPRDIAAAMNKALGE